MYALPKLVFATNNSNKLTEVRDLLAGIYEVVSLDAIGFHDDIEEPYDTFRQNAWTKANTVFQQTGYDCFAEDTGLVIDALGGEPGVRSARYAGEGRNSTDNMHLVLDKMQGQTNRSAHFITVIALHLDRQMSYFEGIAEGTITLAPMGGSGFGYDPIFIPNAYNTTFAEMPKSEKNRISHRAKAIEQLIMYLKSRHKR